MDPLQSEMPEWSSYNYGYCNPITWTDSTGMQPGGGDDPQQQIQLVLDGGTGAEEDPIVLNEGSAIKNAASDVVKEKTKALEDAKSKYDELVSKHQGDLKNRDIRKYRKESNLKNAEDALTRWQEIENRINVMISTFKTVMPNEFDYLNSLPINILIGYDPDVGPSGKDNYMSTFIPATQLVITEFGSDTKNEVWSGEFEGDITITIWGGAANSPFKTNYLANEFGDIDYFFKNVKPNDPVSYKKWSITGNSKYSGYKNDPTGAGQMSFKYQFAFEKQFNSIKKNYPLYKINETNWSIYK